MARKSLAVLVVAALLASTVAPAAAHGWQTTVKQGDFELGISSTPEKPVAGMTTEFTARIMDSTPGDIENRVSWGGVTNKTVEVHVKGPDGYHDHVKVEIPKDSAHFHFNYLFPTDGKYRITVVAKLEGEKYAFAFTRNVTLLPAKATGEEMKHLSEEVHAVNENVKQTNKNVEQLASQVESLKTQVETLQSQVKTLNKQLKQQKQAESVSAPGFGLIAALLAGIGAAFVVGKRR